MTNQQTKVLNECEITVESEKFSAKDILDARGRDGRELPITKEYDVNWFWEDIGKDFYTTFQQPRQYQANVAWVIDRLKVLDGKSVFDAGCGFGRMAPFLLDAGVVDSVDGIDLAKTILDCASEYLEPTSVRWCDHIIKGNDDKWHYSTDTLNQEVPEEATICQICGHKKPTADTKHPPDFRDKINLFLGDARSMPEVDSSKYDVVLSCELLQHLPPEDSLLALREMVRVSNKYLILVERWAFPGEHGEPHLWSHDYSTLFEQLGVDVLQITTIGAGLQGVVARKR